MGCGRTPRDRSASYNTIEYWQDLARTAERGMFDGIFLADIIGVYDVYKDSPAPSILNTVQIPVNDPMLVVPVMAAVTRHIGFGVTSNLTYEPPYLFARRASTLDHLTGGRFGWNIGTGYLDSAARGMGLTTQPDHDGRYDIADEYMEVVYKLWEGSWEDDAVLRDRANRVFADPSKVHRIQHSGRHSGGCDPSRRALTATNTGALPGGIILARPAIRRDACGMRVRERARQAKHPNGCS
jgi:alkanesulfonate monooxygenase SsuD/methylene tetrahydromethanopterin reductase-like flavin-dependent oxidoreductase (luciferase family)